MLLFQVGGIEVDEAAGGPLGDGGALPGGAFWAGVRGCMEAGFEFGEEFGVEGGEEAVEAEGVIGDEGCDEGEVGAGGEVVIGFEEAFCPTGWDEDVVIDLDVDAVGVTVDADILDLGDTEGAGAIAFDGIPGDGGVGGDVAGDGAAEGRGDGLEEEDDVIEGAVGVGVFEHIEAEAQAFEAVMGEDHEDGGFAGHGWGG